MDFYNFMTPIFDPASVTRLNERTDYERWLLEAVYALVEDDLFPSWPDGVIYKLDNPTAEFIGHGRMNAIIGDWRPSFLKAGAPLVFVSTFKLLDMLIEWILEENGISSTFRFQQKLQHLSSEPVFPQLISSRTWLKERLIGLYRLLEPLRGTIIHDRHFIATDGSIRVASSRRGVIGETIEISAANLRRLARVVVSTLKYIDDSWHLDEFREKLLRHDLDELEGLHGLPSLEQRQPFHVCVRVYTTNPNPLLVDIAAIQADLTAHYFNNDCSFDLRVLLVREVGVVDAFLFPWAVFSGANTNWTLNINAEQYRAAIPNDIRPEDLRHV
ncbi:hypothetical protein GCM10011348_36740 [Marinobacterium nitratireducens]|uniref:Uncharacterized protein n=1 Tax=Marinobacterium nitratireducens TaxID=518897 RepID=A0A918DVM2_9GAMM|nr:hypothetical protein [Marinobacterium nitratireducens]GGO86270.1 hypothetical protein GCM10011348_36740 [Marinobacterium nitratireducens]